MYDSFPRFRKKYLLMRFREHHSLRALEQQSTIDVVANDAEMGVVEEDSKEGTEDYTTNGSGMTKKERNRKRAWKAKQSAARNPAPQAQTPSTSAANCEFTERCIA
jgi:hypothetical protein